MMMFNFSYIAWGLFLLFCVYGISRFIEWISGEAEKEFVIPHDQDIYETGDRFRGKSGQWYQVTRKQKWEKATHIWARRIERGESVKGENIDKKRGDHEGE